MRTSNRFSLQITRFSKNVIKKEKGINFLTGAFLVLSGAEVIMSGRGLFGKPPKKERYYMWVCEREAKVSPEKEDLTLEIRKITEIPGLVQFDKIALTAAEARHFGRNRNCVWAN